MQVKSGSYAVRVLSLWVISLWISTAAQAFTLDWTALVPAFDETDTSGSQLFLNVDGSGVDINISYTDNMFRNNSVPSIYQPAGSPSPEILGTLRFTNDRDTLLETSVTISFSQDVFLSQLGTVSLSTVGGLQENIVVEAFDGLASAVFATTYGTNTPGLVALDGDGDAAYRSRGLAAQEDGFYGDTFFSYTDVGVREVRYSLFSTEIGQDVIVLAFSSQGIKDVDFNVVPEPSTATLFGLGLIALTGRRLIRRH